MQIQSYNLGGTYYTYKWMCSMLSTLRICLDLPNWQFSCRRCRRQQTQTDYITLCACMWGNNTHAALPCAILVSTSAEWYWYFIDSMVFFLNIVVYVTKSLWNEQIILIDHFTVLIDHFYNILNL